MDRADSSWLRLTLSSAYSQVLIQQLRHDDRPRWRELATLRAGVTLLRKGGVPCFADAALEALGGRSSWWRRLDFAWSWQLADAAHFLQLYQAERLTRNWAALHVAGTPRLPEGGAVLVSVHQFYQHLGMLRLSSLVDRLGVISNFNLADALAAGHDPTRTPTDMQSRLHQLAALYQLTVGDRVYRSPDAARHGLRLLEHGGYLIVRPDSGYRRAGTGRILGKRVAIAHGALWLAERAGRPIVPFSVVPDGTGWRLWCGAPVAPQVANLDGLLEDCIRVAPSSWMLWPGWFKAPPANAEVAPPVAAARRE